MIYAIIVLACQIIAGWANSVMDTLVHHYSTSKFADNDNQLWWNPSISWRNKYKDGDHTKGPKFFGSTTFLVFTTDAWHFFKWIMLGMLPIPGAILISLIWGASWLVGIIGYIVLRAAFAVTFHVFYHRVFLKKDELEN